MMGAEAPEGVGAGGESANLPQKMHALLSYASDVHILGGRCILLLIGNQDQPIIIRQNGYREREFDSRLGTMSFTARAAIPTTTVR